MRVVLGLLLVAACGSSTATRSPPPEPEPVSPQPATLTPLMAKHFARVTASQRAIIDGDLERAKAQARGIAEEPAPEGMPPAWQPNYGALRAAARATVDAANLVDAAETVAAMAGACGSCHRDLGVTIEMAAESAPPAGDAAADAMLRHQWAADQMWDGLILPSEARWTAGVDALAKAPLSTSELTGAGPIDPELARAAEQIRGWAKIAGESPDQESRQHIYGHFLGACASCHAAQRRTSSVK